MKLFRYALLMCALGFSAVACAGDGSQGYDESATAEETSEVSSELVLRGINVPIAGTLEDGGVFQGTLTITQVALDSLGRATAVGRITGVGTNEEGTSMLVNQQ